jgi:S1-C subfamily serine protease
LSWELERFPEHRLILGEIFMALPASDSSPLQALSNNLADAVEQVGRFVVAIRARSRFAASGIHWQPGVIVTSDRAIERAGEIAVTLPDGNTATCSVAGRDPSTDLAVLKLPNSQLPVPEIGDTSSLRVGNIVLAVGRNSEGGTIAATGSVSAIGGAWRSWCGGEIDRFVRLDLTLYRGLDGSALADAGGQIVGINTSGQRHMALTIPTATVNRVVDQLLAKGRIKRGYLGLGMQSVMFPRPLKQALNLSRDGGVIVVSLEAGGPGDRAGILLGDVLLALDGISVSDTGDVLAVLAGDRTGKQIGVQLIRGGNLVELSLTVGDRPGSEDR